jgi:hypothetical protein
MKPTHIPRRRALEFSELLALAVIFVLVCAGELWVLDRFVGWLYRALLS